MSKIERKVNQVMGNYRLEKFPGKGGWTYAAIPEIEADKKNPFGWVTVSGKIDAFEIKKYKLMPMGNGRLFLPVKSEIRKKIGKEAGDIVRVVLTRDETPLEIPDELMACFKLEPANVYHTFIKSSESKRKFYLDWIYTAKSEDVKAERILTMMKKLSLGDF
jgi:hypothetical protein